MLPFMSIIKDFEIYEQFDNVILPHGVRYVSAVNWPAILSGMSAAHWTGIRWNRVIITRACRD